MRFHTVSDKHEKNMKPVQSTLFKLMPLQRKRMLKNNLSEKKDKCGSVPKMAKLVSTGSEIWKAEILWAFQSVSSGLPDASIDEIAGVFPVMFHDSAIAASFAMKKSKFNYGIQHDIAPFVKLQ